MEEPADRETRPAERPEEPPEPSVVPGCPDCGAEMVQQWSDSPWGTFGALLMVGGVCLCGYVVLAGNTALLPGGVIAFAAGCELTGGRLWWECPDCGRRFACRFPPRGLVSDVEEYDEE